jgi:uncharacterized membrane protein
MQTTSVLCVLEKQLMHGEELLMMGQAHYPFRRKFFWYALVSCSLPIISLVVTIIIPNLGVPMLALWPITAILVGLFVFLGWLNNTRLKAEKETFYALTNIRLFMLLGETATEICSRAQISKIESRSGILTLSLDDQRIISVRTLQGLPKLKG